MKTLIRLALVLASLTNCAAAPAQDGAVTATVAARQILVMLKDIPLRHYQPNAGYGAAYRADTPSARVIAAAEAVSRQFRLRLISHWPMPAIGVRCFLAEIAPGETAPEVAARLANDPRVESAQPVQVFRMLARNDTYYGLQSSAQALHLDRLHEIATGRRVRIAQVDTGVETSHPDLSGQLAEPVNLVEDSDYRAELHGTAVAGVMVARADNDAGVAGIAPGATLLPLRACWEEAGAAPEVLCTSFTLAKAIQYAISGRAQVLNLSLSGPDDRLLRRLIEQAAAQGMAVVAATDPLAPDGGFPARLPQAMAVGSAARALPAGAIRAPGERILTTTPNASWGFLSGSSFAAAHVSGIVALVLEVAPRMPPRELSALLRKHSPRDKAGNGVGVVNACELLAQVARKTGCACCAAVAAHDRKRAS